MHRVLGVEEEQEEELATEEEWETDDEEAVAPASERAGGVTGGTVSGDGRNSPGMGWKTLNVLALCRRDLPRELAKSLTRPSLCSLRVSRA
jgi:hypothetical protein